MTHTGGIDERARLEAIVYGRAATSETERVAAADALRALTPVAVVTVRVEPDVEPVVDPDEVVAPPEWLALAWSPFRPPAVLRRAPRAAAGILTLLAFVGAVAVTPPLPAYTDSMAVFERPQNAADAEAAQEHFNLPGAGPDADLASVRLVDRPAADVAVLVYRSNRGQVCLAIFVDDGGGGQCVAEAEFREDGLAGGTLFPPTGWRFDWGPLGDPVITGPR